MTSFYNLLKYDATGIASPDMSYYDKLRASTLMGGVVQTLTGIPPLSFKADGTPISIWGMKGNTQQTGTPTPDNPVMPTFCGVRTGNLWSEDYTGISQTIKYVPIYVGNGDVTISTTCGRSGTGAGAAAVLFLLDGSVSTGASTDGNGVWNGNDRTVSAVDGYVTVAFRAYTTANPDNAETMLNLGSTALPYEPFGWAEKITCAGQTTPVYLGEVQTVRRIRKIVFDGTETIIKAANNPVFTYQIGSVYPPISDNVISILSSHYQAQANVSGTGNVGDARVCIRRGYSTMYIGDTRYDNAADFKAYLAAQYTSGTPVTVWFVLTEPTTGIVNEPLCKIGTYADELHSTDAEITIPTTKGANTLTVGGDLQPSEMTITFKG